MEYGQNDSNKGEGADVEENIFKRIAIPRTLGNISIEKV